MRWLITSRPSDGSWRLPLLQFLLLIALMLFILATFAVLASQKEPQVEDPPIPLSPADPDPPRISLQPLISPAANRNGIRLVPQSLASVSVSDIRSQANVAAPAYHVQMAAPSAFKGTVTLSGGVRYFHGQTNQRGQTLPLLPLAFLSGERINVTMDFTAEPVSMIITLKDLTLNISGILGQTHYETWLIVPEWERTIDWAGNRVQPTLTMNIHATSRANPLVQTDVAIPGIDIGGSVYDILIMQVA